MVISDDAVTYDDDILFIAPPATSVIKPATLYTINIQS